MMDNKKHLWIFYVLFYSLAILLVDGPLLFSSARMTSAPGCDVWIFWHDFNDWCVSDLAGGGLALWQPHVLGGTPYMGAFEAAVFYPPNLLFLIFPSALAANLSFALHFLLGGLFMHGWLARRKLHPAACLAGGMMFMFCAPFFLRAYAGHLGTQHTIAWIPLIFLVIDALIEETSLWWMLVGTFAVSMLLYAGHPQTIFYTAIIAGVYTLARLPESPRKLASLGAMAGMNLLALGIWAVQLGAGLALMTECSRSGGVGYEFAAMFSFPPENWLTFLSPSLFGDRHADLANGAGLTPHLMYWGRCYLWEMTPFFGICGLPLAVLALGLFWRRRIVWIVAGCAAIGCLLAMGAHMPWFRFMHEHVPGFNVFRGNSKFIIPTVVLLIWLAAHGIDALVPHSKEVGKRPRRPLFLLTVIAGLFCVGVALLAGTAFLSSPTSGWWKDVFTLPFRSGESYLPAEAVTAAASAEAQSFFIKCLLPAIAVLALLAAFAFVAIRSERWHRRLAWLILAVTAADLLVFAWRFNYSYPVADQQATYAPLKRFLADRPGDYRILSVSGANVALPLRTHDMSGYFSQAVVHRYAEFLAWTQGDDPNKATGYPQIRKSHPRFDLMRCRYIIVPQAQGGEQVVEMTGGLPHVSLISDWKCTGGGRDAVFAELEKPVFDPHKTAVLEGQLPASMGTPDGGAAPPAGTVRISREGADFLEVEATLSRPAILLVSDLYTPNWHVRALPGSAQANYELIPADYILRAIPLPAGEHRLRMEYRPRAFVIGAWISAGSLLLFAALACGRAWQRLRRKAAPPVR